MMESCFNNKIERVESVTVEDLKKDLFADFSAIPTALPQDSTLLEKEHLQVYLRIRPFTTAENDNGESQECVAIEPPDVVLLKPPRTSLSARLSDKSIPQTAQRFQFSQVYGPETSQRDIFDGTVKSLVKDVLEGGNSLVFTYGVSNAGKTFTFLGSETDGGILPRSLNVVFNSIEDRIHTQMNIKPHRCREYIRLTKDQQDEEMMNKKNILRFLKESDSMKSMASQLSSSGRSAILEGSTMSDSDGLAQADGFNLDVDSHTKYSVWVSFCEIYNENIHDLLEPIPHGSLKRNVLRLSQDVKGNSFVKASSRFGSFGLKMSEYPVLQQHVPFRESKLTHYLQGFFCGRGKACMVVNINQCASMYDETLNVLKFSAVAQKSQLLLIEELKKKLHEEEYEKLSMESRIREEEDKGLLLDGMMGSMQSDLERIKKDAEAAQTCLIGLLDPHNTNLEKQVAELSEELLKTQQLLTLKTREVESMCSQVQQSNEELKDAKKNCDSQTRKFQELMEICQEKDDMITKLQTAMDHHVETATKDEYMKRT
ncbi:hypothetical protein JZ751_007798 [Albula glossodonta]|uniref:Kinesin motor domain-containing protein n=1 Tax=Albula glossodonta TaxID=121402 RepID=A0A8T2NY36_9TELE|nr:hypothetical protein JZ751_007798 [Albula glossodonta]